MDAAAIFSNLVVEGPNGGDWLLDNTVPKRYSASYITVDRGPSDSSSSNSTRTQTQGKPTNSGTEPKFPLEFQMISVPSIEDDKQVMWPLEVRWLVGADGSKIMIRDAYERMAFEVDEVFNINKGSGGFLIVSLPGDGTCCRVSFCFSSDCGC